MRTVFVLAALVLTPPLALACGVRWSPNQEYVAQTHADPSAAYAKVLNVVNERGYHIIEQSDAERSVRVRAHINENFASQNSFITASVDPSGSVKFIPSGYLVHGDKIHKRLAQELEDLRDATGMGASAAPPAAPVANAEVPPPAASSTPVATPPAATNVPAAPLEPAKPAPKSASKSPSSSKPAPTTSAPSKPAASDKSKSDDDWVPVK